MVTQWQAVKVENGISTKTNESLVNEEPLQISINGKAFSITMRTPGDDQALVKGLLLTEGVVNLAGLQMDPEIVSHQGYTEAKVTVPEIYLCQDLLEKRSLIANAACGVCGKQDVDDLRLDQAPLENKSRLNASLIPRLGNEMRQRQHGFEATGGCHAAAAYEADGTFITQFEDVGRHNAVDKVIGQLVSLGQLDKAAVLQVSGRVSFEIVSKALAAGIPFLCAVSAPSSLAVQMADNAGITLLAFCRDSRFTVYSNPQHIEFDHEES
jgi:FdhD protein